MTFVLAVRLSGANASASPGVDVVVTRASDYPTWAAPGEDPPTLAHVRRAAAREDPAALGFVAGTSATPPPYFRASVKVPGSGANARVLVEGAYNPRRPELDWPNVASFAVRPNTTYVVVAAPRADSTHAAQPGDPQVATLTVRTAEKSRPTRPSPPSASFRPSPSSRGATLANAASPRTRPRSGATWRT